MQKITSKNSLGSFHCNNVIGRVMQSCDLFCVMQSCAMSAKSSIILKLPKIIVTSLEMGKTNPSRFGLL